MLLTRGPTMHLGLRMACGEMTAFDNRRFLHGCYVDRVEYDSRMRQLKPS